jgi:hypothetical protein
VIMLLSFVFNVGMHGQFYILDVHKLVFMHGHLV